MPYTMFLPDGGNNWEIRDMDNKLVAIVPLEDDARLIRDLLNNQFWGAP